MKKNLCLLFALCITLSGCGKKQAGSVPETPTVQSTQQTTDPIPNEQPTELVPEYAQVPMVAVSMPITTEINTDDEGNVISSVTYQTMELFAQDQTATEQITRRFDNRQDKHRDLANSVTLLATASYQSGVNWTPYFYDIVYSPTRIDNCVLSLYGKAVQYTGGNHPYTECTASNYNIVTGDVLTLGSILTNINMKEALCAALIESAALIAEEAQLFDDYPQIIAQRFEKDESYDEDWFFSGTGLCFFFSPYEIAPYVSGSVVIEIPYDQLHGIIDDRFIPAETLQGVGKLCIDNADNVDHQVFTQIAQLTTTNSNKTAILHAEGLIQDVRIYDSNDVPVFRTYALSPSDGILLTADFSQEYQVSYRSGTQTVNMLIHLDTATDSFSLIAHSPE